MNDEFPLVPGIPMHLLTERGLNEAFLDVVERHRREGLPVVVRREGKVVDVPVDQLLPELTRARNRIAELTAEIANFERSPFSINETPE
jgi:acetolactate synthase small subunit